MQIAERDERARRGDDEARPLQADHRDQQADAGRDGVLERRGDRRDEPLAKADARGQHEHKARNRHRPERDAPRHLHAEHD